MEFTGPELKSWLETIFLGMFLIIGAYFAHAGGDPAESINYNPQKNKTDDREWNATFDAIGDAISVIDQHGKIMRCNKAMAELVGKPVAELIGNHCYKVVHNLDAPIPECPLVRMQTSLRRESLEVNLGERNFHVCVDPFFNANGTLIGGVHIIKDVTEQKKTEASLRAVVDSTSAVVGAEFFSSLTRTLANVLDMRFAFVAELINLNRSRTIALWDKDHFAENFEYDLAGTPCENVTTKGLCLYSENVWRNFPEDDLLKQLGVEAYAGMPMRDASGVCRGLIAVMDTRPRPVLTLAQNLLPVFAARAGAELGRIQAEQALRKNEEHLHHVEKMEAIGNLAGGVAHDFNNQLAGIMGYAELLGMKLDNPEMKHYTENIIMAANRSADLTRKLLAFARRGRYQLLPVDMHKLLRDTVQTLEQQISSEIQISINLAAVNCEVLGDPAQLQTVLLNIGSNAKDAMPNGGALLIETREMELDQCFIDEYSYDVSPGDYICVSITDTGCGIPEETKKHIFEPFYTTKPVGKGTGMGLAAAYGIIKNHKGAISCTSEVGRGSTFTIYLPMTKPKKSAQPTAHERPALSNAGLRILVVDDEPMVRDMLGITLESEGCEVSTAGNGREALALYKNKWRKIDLVILDMVLPEMSGRDIFRAMKKINPHIKTLLSSGYSIDGEARSILSEGVLGFIQKPFRKQDLMQLIGEVCPPQSKC